MTEEYNDSFNIEGESEANQEVFEHFRFEVDPGQSMLRIDKYLVDRMQNASRNKIQEAADAGCIHVNEKPVKRNYKVKPNDVITIVLTYPPREIEIIPEDIPLNIVYEDDAFLIVNKNPGMVVHPSYGHYSGTLVNALAHHLKDLPLFNSKDPRPGLVHRIDKDTSGFLVIAKTEDAKPKLGLQFFNKTSDRK
jgi:23S rRNA pseudouridine1911/1915/1917 synthase